MCTHTDIYTYIIYIYIYTYIEGIDKEMGRYAYAYACICIYDYICLFGMLGMLRRWQETHELHFPKQWGRLQRPNLPEDYPAERASWLILLSQLPGPWKIGASSHPPIHQGSRSRGNRSRTWRYTAWSKGVMKGQGELKRCSGHHENRQIAIWLRSDLSSPFSMLKLCGIGNPNDQRLTNQEV